MKSINFLPPTFKLRHIDFEKYSMLKTEDNTIIIQRVPNLNSEIFKDLAAGGLACRRGRNGKEKITGGVEQDLPRMQHRTKISKFLYRQESKESLEKRVYFA